jgi:NitT/TauT family transport system substrate-binding protein
MPSNIVCSKRTEADIRQVVATSYSTGGQRCALIMVRPDAPDFKNPEEAMKWLDGKIVATPFGSCAYKFLLLSFQKLGLKPAEFLNQGIEIISTNFRIKKIDAAAVWEPTASRVGTLAGEGIAKIVATGKVINNPDIGMMMMRGDFIDNTPHLAKGWLKCELEAERFIFDPKNREKAVEMIAKYAVGMPKRAIWFSLYGMIPEQAGGINPKTVCPFIINDEIKKYGQELYDFQFKQKLVPTEKPPANITDDRLTREVLQEAGLTSPVGEIQAVPADQNPFK